MTATIPGRRLIAGGPKAVRSQVRVRVDLALGDRPARLAALEEGIVPAPEVGQTVSFQPELERPLLGDVLVSAAGALLGAALFELWRRRRRRASVARRHDDVELAPTP